ncbi:MAG: FAD:protein FMN transferase, partial [Nitrospirae bacterium]|nr:FAD:protein FMN transferase [Nitrospirota bacterium]
MRNFKFHPDLFGTNFKLFIYCLLPTAYCLLILWGCTGQDRMFKESRIVMDAICTITVVSSSEKEAKAAIEAGFSEIKRLETLLNFFSADSEITAINKAAGNKPVKVSGETLDIINKAVEIANITNGAFDPA